MKKCKIIHVNDACPKELFNANRHFIESFPWTEELIDSYLNQGYEVKNIISNYAPNDQEEGSLSSFIDGFTLYLEKNTET